MTAVGNVESNLSLSRSVSRTIYTAACPASTEFSGSHHHLSLSLCIAHHMLCNQSLCNAFITFHGLRVKQKPRVQSDAGFEMKQ